MENNSSVNEVTPEDRNTRQLRFRFESLLDTSSSSSEDENTTNKEETPLNTGENGCQQQNPAPVTPQHPPNITNDDDDVPDTIILSLTMAKGQLGAAYYNMNTSELFVMDDVMEDDFNYSITKALYKQCQPRYIIMTNGITEKFSSVITNLIMKDALEEENQSTPLTGSVINRMARVVLKLLPKADNNYENCYHRVNCLKLDCEPENATNPERITFLNSLLNFKSRMMIHALGLLLKYLDANWNQLSLNPVGQAQFVNINFIMLQDLVMIDEDTYRALNIMQSRYHPSLFKFGLASKGQSSCLFTFLNRCQSRSGAQFLWKLMRHPTRDASILQERFRAIDFLLRPENQNTADEFKLSLKNISRLPPSIINKFSTTQAKPSDWSKFNTTLSNLINISELCERYRSFAAIFAKIADSLTADIQNVRYFINHIIDFEMSRKARKFMVKIGVDTELDELIHLKRSLPQTLTEMTMRELDNLPDCVESCQMIYVPDIQYCLAITAWRGAPPNDDDEIPGLEFKFSINGVRHYKSNGAKELDRTIGDVFLKITRRRSQIMLRLVAFVGKHIGPILNAIQYCAELDVILSFSMVARDHNYVKPEMLKAHIIDIEGGRHPLRELNGNYVANNTISHDESSLIKILTGPNACGKTVYMKQIAVIVYLAHIGCYVPAESATIGIITHILTQMPAMESIAENASSFLMNLRQTNDILYSSTPNCLIIMDEFGKGTTELDAMALLTAIIKSFIDRKTYCPHIFIATHIHRVVELLPETSIVESQTFDFMFHDDQSLVFLYQLISGNVTRSFAHAVAKSAGLSDKDVEESIKVFKHLKKRELPHVKPEDNRNNVIRHIVEMLAKYGEQVNLDELKQWIRQAIIRRSIKKM